MTMTLADWLRAAQCPVPQEWMEDIPLRKPPYRHQIEGLNLLAQHVRFGLWDDMGLGKTYLMQAHALWLIGLGNRSVMVAPPVLLPQYLQSLKSNFPGIDQKIKAEGYAGDVSYRQKLLDRWEQEGWPDLLVMSYRAFSGIGPSPAYRKALTVTCQGQAEALVNQLVKSAPGRDFVLSTVRWWLRQNGEQKRLSWFPEPAEDKVTTMTFDYNTLLQRGYTDVKVDEANCVSSHANDIHQAVKRFAGPVAESNGVTLATGTPINNSPQDAYGLFALLNPRRYGSKRAFDRHHVVSENFAGFNQVVGYQNLDFLYQGLYSIGRRITKRQVLDMPPKVITEVPVELKDDHFKLYRILCNERVLELKDGEVLDATQAIAFYHAAQQMLLTPWDYGEVRDNALLEALDQIVKGLDGRKVVIYCWYRRSVQTLMNRFKSLNPVALYGDISPQEKENNKSRFIEDPTCKVFILQIKAGGVGVDGLQTVCSDAVYAEIPTVPGVWGQSMDRLYRIGQQSTVNVYLLVPLRTIAVKLRNNLISKEDTANQVVRDKKRLLADLLGEEGLRGTLD